MSALDARVENERARGDDEDEHLTVEELSDLLAELEGRSEEEVEHALSPLHQDELSDQNPGKSGPIACCDRLARTRPGDDATANAKALGLTIPDKLADEATRVIGGMESVS